mmetsp:Transcript_18067/g.37997  ORF Transcript_18067/g.37997 Transcript_18067/m.37997 type:complete len:267 (+) Transcript_18067:1424-2224(+)
MQIKIHRIDIRHEPKRRAPPGLRGAGGVGVPPQRVVHRLRTRVRPADADDDDVLQFEAGAAAYVSRAQLFGKGGDAIQRRVHLLQQHVALGMKHFVIVRSRHPQHVMHDRPPFGEVDIHPGTHFVHSVRESHHIGEIEEQFHRLAVDVLSTVIQNDAPGMMPAESSRRRSRRRVVAKGGGIFASEEVRRGRLLFRSVTTAIITILIVIVVVSKPLLEGRRRLVHGNQSLTSKRIGQKMFEMQFGILAEARCCHLQGGELWYVGAFY